MLRYPFEIMEVFLEGLFSSSVRGFVSDVGILFVARTAVIFRTVSLPVSQAHPTKVVLTSIALHVIASAILFDAYLALWTHLTINKR